ncbi:hypothetical protein [Streptomyces niveus]|uniref:hypothetical protein n=1 Tax=Streptomyces niveus TaxID=193462 RepID=UPI0035D8051B
MEDSKKVCLAAAVAAGYVLGRTKKGKLALGFGALVAGQQIPMNPRALVTLTARKLTENPTVAPLVEQARGDVLGAGRSALSATANRRLEAVANALQQRTEALLEEPLEADEAEDEEEETRPRRRLAKRPAAKKSPPKKAPAKKSANRESRRR